MNKSINEQRSRNQVSRQDNLESKQNSSAYERIESVIQMSNNSSRRIVMSDSSMEKLIIKRNHKSSKKVLKLIKEEL